MGNRVQGPETETWLAGDVNKPITNHHIGKPLLVELEKTSGSVWATDGVKHSYRKCKAPEIWVLESDYGCVAEIPGHSARSRGVDGPRTPWRPLSRLGLWIGARSSLFQGCLVPDHTPLTVP